MCVGGLLRYPLDIVAVYERERGWKKVYEGMCKRVREDVYERMYEKGTKGGEYERRDERDLHMMLIPSQNRLYSSIRSRNLAINLVVVEVVVVVMLLVVVEQIQKNKVCVSHECVEKV